MFEIIASRLEAIQFTTEDYRQVLRRVAELGLPSGAIYDALHARCAQKAAVDQIFTCNIADFDRLQLEGIVVTPP